MLQYIGLNKDFFIYNIPEAQAIKKKIEKWDYIKLKMLLRCKEKNMKRKMRVKESANYVSDK